MAERVTYLTDRRARLVKQLNWDCPESVRIQREYGDPGLRCAWRADIGRWVLAHIERVGVVTRHGRRETVEFERMPVQFKIWQDDEGQALRIDDPRLIPLLRKSDNRLGADERMIAAVQADEADEAAKQDELEREFADMFKDTRSAWVKMADKLGVVPHRRGGHEGGKISSASLWRVNAPKKLESLTVGATAA